jgi:hypothetical protein
MAIPKCYRCRVRSLECHYPSSSLRRTLPTSSASLPQGVDTISADEYETSLQTQGAAFDFNLLADNLSLPPFPDYDLDWQEAMTHIQDFSVPDILSANDTAGRSVLAGQIYQHRVVYAVERFKSFPTQLVLQGQNPFIHNRLLGEHLSKPLCRILGICSFYQIKSETNKHLVYASIQQYSDELIDIPQMAESDIELLAITQAWILLQIIRLFDGDIRQRSNAENAHPVFLNSIRRLQQRMKSVKNPGQDIASIIRTQGSDAWEAWSLAESIRRTVMLGHSLDGLYSFLKNGWDDASQFEVLSFFGQGALWCATSRFEWESAVAQRQALPIQLSNWDSCLMSAKPEDMEELGIIIMALVKGVDYCCHWVGNDLLKKFGLNS